jgi:hypothetical protein
MIACRPPRPPAPTQAPVWPRREIGRDRQGHNLVSAGAGRNLRVFAFMTAVASMFNLAEEQVHWLDAALGCAIALAVLLAAGGRIGGEPMTTQENCTFWLSLPDRDAPRDKQIPGVAKSRWTPTPRPSRSSVEAWHQSGRAVTITRLHDRAHRPSQESTERSSDVPSQAQRT